MQDGVLEASSQPLSHHPVFSIWPSFSAQQVVFGLTGATPGFIAEDLT